MLVKEYGKTQLVEMTIPLNLMMELEEKVEDLIERERESVLIISRQLWTRRSWI